MAVITSLAPYSDERGNVIEGAPKHSNVSVAFRSEGCRLIIHDNAVIENLHIKFMAPGGVVKIGAGSIFKGWITVGLESRVEIGNRVIVTNPCAMTVSERQSISLGDDCMLGSGVEIRADDSHPIFDIETGTRLNPSHPVKIGRHVWLAVRSVVLRGSEIGDGSVIGHSSVVKGTIPANCIAAGTPAKVIREGVVWDKTNLAMTPPFEFPDLSSLGGQHWTEDLEPATTSDSGSAIKVFRSGAKHLLSRLKVK